MLTLMILKGWVEGGVLSGNCSDVSMLNPIEDDSKM